MSSIFRKTLTLVSLLSLSGCAFLNAFNSDLDKQIDTWMAQHEYARIIDTVQYVRPSNPKYALLQKKRQQAIVEAKRYEQAQISKSLNLVEKGQWQEAELTLNDALDKLPQSAPLQKTYQEFLKQRASYLGSLNTQLTINKAEWLIKDRPVQQQISRALPVNGKNRNVMEQYRRESQDVFQQLVSCGNHAELSKDFALAEKCYLLADRLKPDTDIKDKLANIQKRLMTIRMHEQAQKQTAPAISQLGLNLLGKSKKALQGGHLKQAIDYYDKIPDNDRNLDMVAQYGSEMHHRIRDNVNQGIELGRKLYSQGQVEQALAVWNKLRDLDPENENLLSHIDRAERVLEKVKKLREEQSQETTSPPTNSGK